MENRQNAAGKLGVVEPADGFIKISALYERDFIENFNFEIFRSITTFDTVAFMSGEWAT